MPMNGQGPHAVCSVRADRLRCWRALGEARGPVVLVGNEIGLGVIPLGREVRAFVDALGCLNQRVAAACDRVTLDGGGPATGLEGRGAMMLASRLSCWRSLCCAGRQRWRGRPSVTIAASKSGWRSRRSASSSLLPSLTESVCALGACDRLVGVDRYSNWPASVQALPQLGGLEDANVERIVALKPDVVLACQVGARHGAAGGLGIQGAGAGTQVDEGRANACWASSARCWAAKGQARVCGSSIDAGVTAAAPRCRANCAARGSISKSNSGPYAAGEASFIGETLARLGVEQHRAGRARSRSLSSTRSSWCVPTRS